MYPYLVNQLFECAQKSIILVKWKTIYEKSGLCRVLHVMNLFIYPYRYQWYADIALLLGNAGSLTQRFPGLPYG